MRWGVLAILALLGSATAGCIGDGGPELDSNTALTPTELSDPLAALEAGKDAANLDLLGTFRDGGAQEAHPWGDFLFVDQGSRVTILNVSNPEAIEKVSELALPAVVDVKVSHDGEWLFAVDDAEASGDNPLAGQSVFIGGLYAIDISDKSAPVLVAYTPLGTGRGPHMVFYHVMPDGTELLAHAAGESVILTSFDRATGMATELSRYTPGPLAQDPDPRVLDPYYGVRGWVHDMFVMDEPNGDVTMYVAAWDAGLHIVDVTDPRAPTLAGSWNDVNPEEEEGNIHTVVPAQIGDRRIVVGSVEVGFLIVGGPHWALHQDKPILYVWDATDPANVVLLGTWINPIKDFTGRNAYTLGPLPGEKIDSTHNFQIENGRIYLAHYHLGQWVLDISTPALQADPAILGYFFDSEANEVWDVVLNNGAVFATGTSGVIATHFKLDQLGPAGVTSRA